MADPCFSRGVAGKLIPVVDELSSNIRVSGKSENQRPHTGRRREGNGEGQAVQRFGDWYTGTEAELERDLAELAAQKEASRTAAQPGGGPLPCAPFSKHAPGQVSRCCCQAIVAVQRIRHAAELCTLVRVNIQLEICHVPISGLRIIWV